MVAHKLVNTKDRTREKGIGIAELLIVVAIIGIVSAIAVINFRTASASVRLQNSVRQLSSHMEKARIDAVRRHDSASVTFTSPTSYRVHMDFNNAGVITDRNFSFQSGVQVASSELPTVTFDWRGRTAAVGSACVTTFSVKNTNPNEGLSVDVSGSGDVTVENKMPDLPNIAYTDTDSSAGVSTQAAVNGAVVVDNSPCVSVAGIVGGDSGPPSCAIHSDKTSLSMKKNGGATGSVLINMSVSTLVLITKPSNLTVSPTSATVTPAGSTFLITSNNTLRGPFDVVFSSQCGSSITVRVNVTN